MQTVFNQVRGTIIELNDSEKFCSITLEVGHEKARAINLLIKKPEFDEFCKVRHLGDCVALNYFLSSRFKHGRWYSMANVISWIP